MFTKALLKKTGLFNHLSQDRFNKLLQKLRIRDFKSGETILHEGDLGHHFYIIKKGSVRIYKHDLANEEIPLARLEKGAYFGEQALLGETKNTRSASAKAITSVKLIEIPGDFLKEAIKKNIDLERQLREMGSHQLFSRLTASWHHYNEILQYIQDNKLYRFVEFDDEQVIFSAGDPPDYAYFILTGAVEIRLAALKKLDSGIRLISEGHILGEFAILNNEPRAGTAIAKGKVKALQIAAEDFKKLYEANPELQEFLYVVHNSYQMASRGNVTQFLGKYQGADAVSTLFKLNDGGTVLATRILDTDTFAMQNLDVAGAETLEYQNQREISLNAGQIVGVKSIGYWDELGAVCQMIFEKTFIDAAYQENFVKNGYIGDLQQTRALQSNDLVCECMSVTKKKLDDLIKQGITSLQEISELTGACTVCRSCKPRILELLGKSQWKSAVMSRKMDHNEAIRTYKIIPTIGKFEPTKPGKFIILQVKIGSDWVERSYTLSSLQDRNNSGHYQVTIKQEPKGFFTRWLFEEANDSFLVKVSKPQGEFTLRENKVDIVCFAGGVGITPFLPFAQSLQRNNSTQRMHIVYSALTQDDFIFIDEFEELCKSMPNLTIEKWSSNEKGLLQPEKITEIIQNFNDPDIYICGPAGFVSVIKKTLKQENYPSTKIHTEKFVHAGGPSKEK